MHAAQDRRDFRRATTDPQWGKDRGDDNVANSTLASARCVLIYGRNRRRLCPVQCGRVVASTSARSYVEQRLVSTVCICRYQLYEELDVCLFCSFGVVDWGIRFDDTAAQTDDGRDGGAGTHPISEVAASIRT